MHVNFADLTRWYEAGILKASPDEVVGVCAAVGAAPSFLQPYEWFELVFASDGLTTFDDARDCIHALLEIYNEILATYHAGNVPGPSSEDEEAIAAWCKGYLAAALRDPLWLDDETGTRLLAPIGALSDPEAMLEDANDRAVALDLHVEWRTNLIGIARAIYDFWEDARLEAAEEYLALSSPHRTFRRENRRVGRNESCPCGSGNKYKRCCALDG
jgi:uncharacterized protein